MYIRLAIKISILASILFISVWLASCAPERSSLSSKPHINPEAIQISASGVRTGDDIGDSDGGGRKTAGPANVPKIDIYDDTSLMRYVNRALDFVLAGKAEDVGRQGYLLAFAAVRSEVAEHTESFFQSASVLSGHTEAFISEMDTVTSLLKENRLGEAKERASGLLVKAPQVIAALDKTEKSLKSMGKVLAADRVPEDNELRINYDGAVQRFTQIKQPIETLIQFAKDGDTEALMRKLQIQIDIKKFRALRPTELTLEITPTRAFVGDTVTFKGRLTSREGPLPGRDIAIDLEANNYAIVTSASDGSYSGELTLPYKYGEGVTIRARYLPRGQDADLYVAAVSPSVEVETPFYLTGLHLDIPTKAYQGHNLAIKGRFTYGDQTLVVFRKLEIFLDGSLVSSVALGEDFRLELALDKDMKQGIHNMAMGAPGAGRYGPASATVRLLDVVRATPVVDLNIPRLTLIPLSLDIRGKVESDVAPLNGAGISLRFGQNMAKVTTSADGTFSYSLRPGFYFTPLGQQALDVEVAPQEPWNNNISVRRNIMVVNPAGLGLIALTAAVVATLLRFRGRAKREALQVASGPPVLVTEDILDSSNLVAGRPSGNIAAALEPGKDREQTEDKVLQTYKDIVRFVMSSLGITIRPHLTLRDFVMELTPRLGETSSYMWQMTFIVERVIYSNLSLTERDREDLEKLSVQVRRGIKHGLS